MRIREAHPDEHDAVGALTVAGYASAEYFRVEGNPYVTELRDVRGRATDGVVLVAVEQRPGEPTERLLGTATYVPRPGPSSEFDDPGGAGIRMVAVDPEAQGRGVATALGRVCLDLAVADGRDPVVLHTVAGYDLTARLWRRLGFRPDPARDWSPQPQLLLRGWTWHHPDRFAPPPGTEGAVARPVAADRAGRAALPGGLHHELVPAADPRPTGLVDALARELAGRYGRAVDVGPPPGDGDDVWLVTRDARPLATLVLRPAAAADGVASTAQVTRWVVDVAERGRGLGRRLLAEAVAQAGHRGLQALELVVGDRQPEAVALAAAAGWQRVTAPRGVVLLRREVGRAPGRAPGAVRGESPLPWGP